MKVLIPTETDDSHAKVVARALEQRGHQVHLWYASDLPVRQALSLTFDGSRPTAAVRIAGDEISAEGPFDVVWLRRATQPMLPADMHPGDREFATEEWTRFLRGAWQVLAPDAFWVNPWENALRAESKSRQLAEATRVGFRIPETLCSNDPARIREFLAKHARGTIYKPFCTAQWKSDEGTAFLFTSEVRDGDLPSDEVLRLSPGIFQPLIPKSHELRVTMLGERAVAVRLDSQARASTRIDWRTGSYDMSASPIALPEDIESKCRRLMRALGLAFGCIDLIVTPEDEFVFLEINQMGQFLWLEELLPELRLLDGFCTLLESRRLDFEWHPSRATLSFATLYDPELEATLDSRHVESPMFQCFAESPHRDDTSQP